MVRQIILDTETTGIGPELGHRVIEIGCVELVDRKLTGKHYHVYLNPQREVEKGLFVSMESVRNFCRINLYLRILFLSFYNS